MGIRVLFEDHAVEHHNEGLTTELEGRGVRIEGASYTHSCSEQCAPTPNSPDSSDWRRITM